MKPSAWLAAVRGLSGFEPRETGVHLKLAGDWLLRAQDAGGGGYAHSYSLVRGWLPPYPETTGYILPTMLRVSEPSARRAGDWLLAQQAADGSFKGLDGQAYVFDTAQAVSGLLAIHEASKDERFLAAARKAGAWLAAAQEKDGSWVRHAYGGVPHSYYIKAAAALLRLGRLSKDETLREAAKKNFAWTLSQRLPNGFFQKAAFGDGDAPFIHTIVYILEGLLEGHALEGDPAWRAAAEQLAKTLLDAERRDFILSARYDEEGQPIGRQRCVVGLAQWARCALELQRLNGDPDLLRSAVKNIYHLKARQLQVGPPEVLGSLPASLPFWGRYVPYSFVNWGVKYFIDALQALQPHGLTLPQEQELYVREAFRSTTRYVPSEDGLRAEDKQAYLGLIKEEIVAAQGRFPGEKVRVADVGAGGGAWVRALRAECPGAEILGVDPSFADGKVILEGSAYKLPLPERSVHVLLLKEVLQHVAFMDAALGEAARVMRSGGTVLVIDRNPCSFLGLLKPYYELTGRWMYPWDSAFREAWRGRRAWQTLLARLGDVRRTVSLNNASGRRFFFNRENRFFFFTIQTP